MPAETLSTTINPWGAMDDEGSPWDGIKFVSKSRRPPLTPTPADVPSRSQSVHNLPHAAADQEAQEAGVHLCAATWAAKY